jgi:protein-tyrosine phosphatase
MTDVLVPFAPPDRWVPLRGARNCRDLGGYLTASGAAVRWRRLFRSDALDAVVAADVARLRDDLGVRTVVDLRCEDERCDAVDGWAPLRVAVPIEAAPPGAAAPGVTLADRYLHLLRKRAARIRLAVEVVVEAEHPVLVHGADGRDRTGLVAAVLLGALGVGDDDIARDYALAPPAGEAADRDTMRSVLRSLRREHGSMLGYALDIGVGAESIAVLRDRLLD